MQQFLSPDVPPAIEPRIEFLQKTPPAPPPRPKKVTISPLQQPQPTSAPPPPPQSIQQFFKAHTKIAGSSGGDMTYENKPKLANVIDLKRINQSTPFNNHIIDQTDVKTCATTEAMVKIPATKHFLEEHAVEELELLTPGKTKNLTLKKKNSILGKRRRITLKTLEVSDIQGHLYRRSKDKHGVTYWAKLYVVLADTALYGFRSKDSEKAHSLIFLSGFTVSIAAEVHSKPYAFKVYHPTKTFYFAAESQQALNQWIDYIKQATLKGNSTTVAGGTTLSHISEHHNVKELYSETESSGDEFEGAAAKQLGTPSPSMSHSIGRFGIKKNSGSTATVNEDVATALPTPPPTSKYHLGFGSLKKFTKQNLPFSSSSSSKSDKANKKSLVATNSDVPIPTAQFRSYRKVPGNAGLQLGTNSMISNMGNSDFVPPLLSSTESPVVAAQPPPPPTPTLKIENIRKTSITSLVTLPSAVVTPPSAVNYSVTSSSSFKLHRELRAKPKKLRKTSPYNYIHASNPNLVEFDFPTSKTLDYSFPKVNPSNIWDAHHSLTGFVTLKDLMLQKQEEDAKEMYNNRVNLGVEKKNDSKAKRSKRRTSERQATVAAAAPNNDEQQYNGGSTTSSVATTDKQNYNKIQSRTLPKTPDYEQSFKPDDSDIIMTRSREGQKLRDFGYEFISGDDPQTTKHVAGGLSQSAVRQAVQQSGGSSRKKGGLTWMHAAADRRTDSDSTSSRGGSFKKSKNKLVAETLETFKSSSEKLFQFKYANSSISSSSSSKDQRPEKPVKPSHLPLILPLNRKTSVSSSSSSSHYNNPACDDNIMVQMPLHVLKKSSTVSPVVGTAADADVANLRKNSAPERSGASYFTKLNFSASKTAKEKKLLGSPRLHRALFGRRESADQVAAQDHEIFSPIDFKV